MDLERVKQLRNEYAEQHIISMEQFEKSKRIYTAKKQLYPNHHKPLNQTVLSTMRK